MLRRASEVVTGVAGKPLEEQLGTAMAGPGHGLEQPEIRHLACWRGGGHAGSA